jgi:hypothetical protein
MTTMITVVLDAAAIAGVSGNAMPATAEVVLRLGHVIERALPDETRPRACRVADHPRTGTIGLEHVTQRFPLPREEREFTAVQVYDNRFVLKALGR